MKIIFRVLLTFFSLTLFTLKAQTFIQIKSNAEFSKMLKKNDIHNETLNLEISDVDFLKNFNDSIYIPFSNWGGLKSIHNFTLRNTNQIEGKNLIQLLKLLPSEKINSISLINLNNRNEFFLPKECIYQSLERLTLVDMDIDEEFFSNFSTANLPALKFLEMNNCDLDDDFMSLFNKSGLLQKIEYLDLSKNDNGNSLFSMFPFDKESNLKTLKLNQCKIILDKYKNFSQEYLGVCKSVVGTKPAVDWNCPYFSRLEHLEMQNKENLKFIKLFLEEDFFRNLKYFLGFTLEDIKSNNYDSEIKHEERMSEYFKVISESGLKSVINNYEFKTATELNIFLKSGQAKISENIILIGKRWNYIAAKTILTNKSLPSLKEISLVNPDMNQEEVMSLIQEFPNLSFNVLSGAVGNHWPLIEKKVEQ